LVVKSGIACARRQSKDTRFIYLSSILQNIFANYFCTGTKKPRQMAGLGGYGWIGGLKNSPGSMPQAWDISQTWYTEKQCFPLSRFEYPAGVMSISLAICTPLKLRQRRRMRILVRTVSLMCIVLGLDAVHIGLPKGAAVHAANLVHWLCIKGCIGDVDPVLKPTHAVCFVGPIRLNGYARDEHRGFGALWRAAGGKSEDNGGENERFFHCGYGVKK
jgi:hypothetical protein